MSVSITNEWDGKFRLVHKNGEIPALSGVELENLADAIGDLLHGEESGSSDGE